MHIFCSIFVFCWFRVFATQYGFVKTVSPFLIVLIRKWDLYSWNGVPPFEILYFQFVNVVWIKLPEAPAPLASFPFLMIGECGYDRTGCLARYLSPLHKLTDVLIWICNLVAIAYFLGAKQNTFCRDWLLAIRGLYYLCLDMIANRLFNFILIAMSQVCQDVGSNKDWSCLPKCIDRSS